MRVALGNRAIDVLESDLSDWPLDDEEIEINYADLAEKTEEQLIEILSKIPASVRSLYICYNGIGEIAQAVLVKALYAIPKTVSSFTISYNSLQGKKLEELEVILCAIPHWLSCLTLNGSAMTRMSIADTQRLFNLLPESISSLSLSSFFAHKTPVNKIRHVVEIVPVSVRRLNLGYNQVLQNISSDDFISILKGLSPSINFLSLAGLYLGSPNRVRELPQVFASLPSSVISLDLTGNYLGNLTVEQMRYVFSSLPETTKILSLSRNNLDNVDDHKALGDMLLSLGKNIIIGDEDPFSRKLIHYVNHKLITECLTAIKARHNVMGGEEEVQRDKLPSEIWGFFQLPREIISEVNSQLQVVFER